MAIRLRNLSKSYRALNRAGALFRELVLGSSPATTQPVLHPISLDIAPGEVVGLIGVNGAGKSTFLKLIAGMLRPSTGSVECDGHLCALLELGAGFHPEMTGRENVFLAGAVAGQSANETQNRFDAIIDFAGLRGVMDRPVKTYSSGMIMRLAFSVATAVDPDILILDETLSVGDGAFARKSFDRIMAFKSQGKTILFCSHSLYQVEAICGRVLWLDQGRLMMDGPPSEVVRAYNDFLLNVVSEDDSAPVDERGVQTSKKSQSTRILAIRLASGDQRGARLVLQSEQSDLVVAVDYLSDLNHPPPSLGVMISGSNGRPVTSALSLRDGCLLKRDAKGMGRVSVVFPKLALLRGQYWVNVFLLCDQGLHVHESAYRIGDIEIDQAGPELGVVSLMRRWTSEEVLA